VEKEHFRRLFLQHIMIMRWSSKITIVYWW